MTGVMSNVLDHVSYVHPVVTSTINVDSNGVVSSAHDVINVDESGVPIICDEPSEPHELIWPTRFEFQGSSISSATHGLDRKLESYIKYYKRSFESGGGGASSAKFQSILSGSGIGVREVHEVCSAPGSVANKLMKGILISNDGKPNMKCYHSKFGPVRSDEPTTNELTPKALVVPNDCIVNSEPKYGLLNCDGKMPILLQMTAVKCDEDWLWPGYSGSVVYFDGARCLEGDDAEFDTNLQRNLKHLDLMFRSFEAIGLGKLLRSDWIFKMRGGFPSTFANLHRPGSVTNVFRSYHCGPNSDEWYLVNKMLVSNRKSDVLPNKLSIMHSLTNCINATDKLFNTFRERKRFCVVDFGETVFTGLNSYLLRTQDSSNPLGIYLGGLVVLKVDGPIFNDITEDVVAGTMIRTNNLTTLRPNATSILLHSAMGSCARLGYEVTCTVGLPNENTLIEAGFGGTQNARDELDGEPLVKYMLRYLTGDVAFGHPNLNHNMIVTTITNSSMEAPFKPIRVHIIQSSPIDGDQIKTANSKHTGNALLFAVLSMKLLQNHLKI